MKRMLAYAYSDEASPGGGADDERALLGGRGRKPVAAAAAAAAAGPPAAAARTVHSFGVAVLCFAAVAGGPYGIEAAVGAAGALPTLGALLVTALVWSLPQAQVTAELSNLYPSNAGYVVWVLRGLGPTAGFVNAYACVLSALLNLPLYPVLVAEYAAQLAPSLSPGALWGVKLAVVGFGTALNVAGVAAVERVALVMTLLVQTPFVVMPLYAAATRGAGAFSWGALGGAQPGWFNNFSVFIATICWNGQGWSNLGNIAGEVALPATSYPRGTGAAVLLVAANYVYPVVLCVALAPDAGAWDTGYFVTLAASLSPALGVWATVAAALSCVSNFVPWLTTASRGLAATAAAGMLPVPALARVWARTRTPVPAILAQAVAVSALCALDFQTLVVLEILFANVGLALQFAAFVALRAREPDAPRPYAVPGGWAGVAAVVAPFYALLAVVLYASAAQSPALFGAVAGVVAALAGAGAVWARVSYSPDVVAALEAAGADAGGDGDGAGGGGGGGDEPPAGEERVEGTPLLGAKTTTV